jgi:hypothetical protein
MQIISNLGNSLAGVKDTIEAKEAIHWTIALRQAELTILDKTGVLRTNTYSRSKAVREHDLLQEQIKYLKFIFNIFSWVPILGIWLRNKLADIRERIANFEITQPETEKLFRDCRMELDAATAKKQEILAQYPEAESLTFMQLQEKYGEEALVETIFAYMEPRIRSQLSGIPESVGVALYEVSPRLRNVVLERIQKLQQEYLTPTPEAIVGNAIASLPPERRQVFLGLLASEMGNLPNQDSQSS